MVIHFILQSKKKVVNNDSITSSFTKSSFLLKPFSVYFEARLTNFISEFVILALSLRFHYYIGKLGYVIFLIS